MCLKSVLHCYAKNALKLICCVFGVVVNAVQLRSFILRKLVEKLLEKKSYLFWISICANLFCLKPLQTDFVVFWQMSERLTVPSG